ncbi:MAG: hypothetical protein LQ347_005829, partial [Umbilicaria vellea]
MGFPISPAFPRAKCTGSTTGGAIASAEKASKHSEGAEQVIEKCVSVAQRRRRDEEEWQLVYAEGTNEGWEEIERPR